MVAALAAMGGIDRARLEEFVIHEARLLDERRFREWMELFADDGTYWVPWCRIRKIRSKRRRCSTTTAT